MGFAEQAASLATVSLVIIASVTYFTQVIQGRQEARKLAVEIWRKHNSIEFYSKISGPAWRFQLLWQGTCGERKQKLAKQLVYGCLHRCDQKAIDTFFRDEEGYSISSYEDDIYRQLPEHTRITPYEAVFMYIHFWSEVWILIDQKIVNRRLIRKLLGAQFDYRSDFLLDLARTIENPEKYNETFTDNIIDSRPEWIDHIVKLHSFFGSK